MLAAKDTDDACLTGCLAWHPEGARERALGARNVSSGMGGGRASCGGLRWWHRSLHSMPMLHYFLLICFGCISRGVFNGVQAMSAETTSNFIHLAEL